MVSAQRGQPGHLQALLASGEGLAGTQWLQGTHTWIPCTVPSAGTSGGSTFGAALLLPFILPFLTCNLAPTSTRHVLTHLPVSLTSWEAFYTSTLRPVSASRPTKERNSALKAGQSTGCPASILAGQWRLGGGHGDGNSKGKGNGGWSCSVNRP